jgi:hypothetical protein
MFALPPKADMDQHGRDVRFVPKADILHCKEGRGYSITSSASARSDGGTRELGAAAWCRFWPVPDGLRPR